MSIQIIRVDWQGRDQSGGTASFTFDDIESIAIKKDSDISASSCNIVLKNIVDRFQTGFTQPFTKYNQNTNDLRFKEGDTVKIYAADITSYRAIDTSSSSADLLMSGEIAEVNVKEDQNGAKITLKIIDKTYVILNRLYTYAYTTSAGLTAPQIVQAVIRFITDDVDSDPLSYDDDGNHVINGKYSVDARLVSDGGFIEDTRKDGSAFPVLAMAKVAKPGYDWIKSLSAIDSTNDFTAGDDEDAPTQDRNMIFYVDELNRFHWFYPRDILTTTLNEDLDTSETTVTLTDASLFPIVGTVFVGTERIDYTGRTSNDLTGCTRGANNTTAATHSTGDTVRNAVSIISGDTSSLYTHTSSNLTKATFDIVNFVIFNCGADMYGNGITAYFFDKATKSKSLKDTYKTYNDISAKLMQEEINSTPPRLTQDNTVTSAFTFKGNRYKETTGDYDGGAGITTAWGAVVTTNTGYNTAFRAECIRQGKIQAQKLTNKKGSPRWKGNMGFRFKRFPIGDLFEYTSTRAGINQQPLRVKSAIYNFTKSGASASVEVEEDEGKLGAT